MSILLHVGRLGWDKCVWSDDNLCTKKVYPGYQFSAKAKKWLPRLRTTAASHDILVHRFQAVHEATPEYMRKKPEASKVETSSERAAAVVNLAEELQTVVPVPKQDSFLCQEDLIFITLREGVGDYRGWGQSGGSRPHQFGWSRGKGAPGGYLPF